MNTTPIDHKIEFMAYCDDTNELTHMDNFKHYEDEPNHNEKIAQFCNWYYGCELMQRTALRSTSDEPIYNHMIVKNEFGDYFLVDMFNYQIMEFLTRFDLEIVGNRFQSPELLELCK